MFRSKKTHLCSFCGARGRNVVYYPLMKAYLHYECWMTECGLNLRAAFVKTEDAAIAYVNDEVDGSGEPYKQMDLFE